LIIWRKIKFQFKKLKKFNYNIHFSSFYKNQLMLKTNYFWFFYNLYILHDTFPVIWFHFSNYLAIIKTFNKKNHWILVQSNK
jgi:hypothetical protein